MQLLNLIHHILAFDADEGSTNNPLRRIVDWTRSIKNFPVDKAKSDVTSLTPNQALTLFSGAVSTAIDGTTAFDLSLVLGSSNKYRLTHSAGTAPAFRAARSISTDATSQLSVMIDNNATATFTASGGTIASFTPVVVGDILRISGTSVGDLTSPFNDLNEGYWVVLAKTATTLTCKRTGDDLFSGTTEASIVLGASFATNFIVYSSAGVQENDKMAISAGFSSITQKTFVVLDVTPTFIEFSSTEPLPLETSVIPTASGLAFYRSSKKVIYLETDQDLIVRVNGQSGSQLVTTPLLAGDSTKVGIYHQIGTIFSLEVENKSSINSLNLFVFTAE